MASADLSYQASGFYEDCTTLLELFKSNNSIRFGAFCEAWKELKFSLVFLGRKKYAEMLEFCEEALNIAKQFLLKPTELIDKVGGLYLLYGLYYKIPLYDVKIRVTYDEWKHFLNLHRQIKDEKFHDASYIFTKLVMDNAYHHCLFETEYGLEKSFKFRHDQIYDNPYSVVSNIADDIENGELGKIQRLSKIYDEQKAKLLNNTSSTNKLQLFDKNFMDDVFKDVVALQEKRQTVSRLRNKNKELTIFDKTEISKPHENRTRPKLGHGFDTDSSETDDDENVNMKLELDKSEEGLPKTFDDDDDHDDHDDNDGDSDGVGDGVGDGDDDSDHNDDLSQNGIPSKIENTLEDEEIWQ